MGLFPLEGLKAFLGMREEVQTERQGQRTLSRRLSSIDFEYSLSLYSSRSMCALSMSADRWGILETQATVRSEAGIVGFSVDGVWEC